MASHQKPARLLHASVQNNPAQIGILQRAPKLKIKINQTLKDSSPDL